jgi:hypothetical protein
MRVTPDFLDVLVELLIQPAMPQPCALFRLAARCVWALLRNSSRFQLGISEESITDFLLLSLKRAFPNNVFIKKFTKVQEGKTTGADWEWWLIGGGYGFGMRIQAKKLDADQLRYFQLAKTCGKARRASQIDLLLKDVQKPNLYPAYCFYNFWDQQLVKPCWNCCSSPPDWRLFGCSIADARAVKRLVIKGKDDLQSVAKMSFPWSCLVCCDYYMALGGGTIAHRAQGLAVEMARRSEDEAGRVQRQVPHVLPLAGLPGYVRTAFEEPGAEIERPEGRKIDGLVVFKAH